MAQIVGTGGNNQLNGTGTGDTVLGQAGNDTISGGGCETLQGRQR